MALLEIDTLSVAFQTAGALFTAVDRMSIELNGGEVLSIVGESGSGKSVSMLALMGLLPWTAQVSANKMAFDGKDLLNMEDSARRSIIGKEISMIFQEPMTSLNPCFTVGFQVGEALKTHLKMDRKERRERSIDLLNQVGIPEPQTAVSLSAPALRRHVAAGDDRHGHRLQSPAADRR